MRQKTDERGFLSLFSSFLTILFVYHFHFFALFWVQHTRKKDQLDMFKKNVVEIHIYSNINFTVYSCLHEIF